MKSIACLFVFLLALLGTDAWAAQPSVNEVVRALRRYNSDEARLLSAKETSAAELLRHWQELAKIRARLESVRAAGAPAAPSSIALRHELAQLFSGAAGVADVRGDFVNDRVTGAAEAWKRHVLAIAHWANRHFDFELQEVFGIPLY